MNHPGGFTATLRILIGLITTTAMAVLPAAGASAHAGDPNFRSIVNSITPKALAKGLEGEVVNFDDHVVLENGSGKDVVVLGYENGPYARIDGDGLVAVNLNSPSHYLNEDRFANVDLPDRADRSAPPDWVEVDRTGRFEWHDHRSHYMGEGIPSQVTDESVRTKVFDYEIPLTIDGKPARLDGTLVWAGRDTGIPVLPFVLLALVVIAAGGLLWVRRRSNDDPIDGEGNGRASEKNEAW